MKIYIIDFSENTGFEVEAVEVEYCETYRLKTSQYFIYRKELDSICFDGGQYFSCSVYCTDKKMIFRYIDAMKKMVLEKIDIRISKLKELKKKVKKFN